MKQILVAAIVALFAALSISAQIKGQPREKRLASSPQAFRTFFAEFKNAVAKSDKVAVAAMTRFPFSYGFDAGDEGKMSRAAVFEKVQRGLWRLAAEISARKKPGVFPGRCGQLCYFDRRCRPFDIHKEREHFQVRRVYRRAIARKNQKFERSEIGILCPPFERSRCRPKRSRLDLI